MKLLLDTHVFLWWLDDSAQLSPRIRDAVSCPENLVYVSAVTLWEIVVKRSLGKLRIADEWTDVLASEAFRALPVTWEHALEVGRLPDLHRDPFDRLLLAQARVERLVLATQDASMVRYPVETLSA